MRRLIVLLGIVAVLTAIGTRSTLAGWWRQWMDHRRGEAFIRAVNALPERPLEARLSGGTYAYRPLQKTPRGKPRERRRISLVAAASAIEASAAAPPRDIAAARLLTGDWDGAIDEWTTILRQGRRGIPLDNIVAQSTDAGTLSDLACAYYERSRAHNRPVDLIIAAALADRAYHVAPSVSVHAWNRALTIEALGVLPEAAKAWRDYLSMDSTSDWAAEAKQRLQELEVEPDSVKWQSAQARIEAAVQRGETAVLHATVRHDPIRFRALIDGEWISQWAAQEDEVASTKRFAAIEAAANGLRTGAGDEFLVDFVNRARAAVELRTFTVAHRRIAAVGETLRNEGTMPAVAVIDDVVRHLDRVESPYAIALRVEKAGHLYHAGRFREALTTLDAIQPAIDARKWPLLAARAAWNRGVSLASLGNVRAAAASYERALELYGRAGDKTQIGMLQTLLADNAEMAGRSDETWYRYVTAVRSIERHGEPWRSIVILDGFTRAAVRAGHPLFARLLNDILIGRSQGPEDAPYLCHALITACDVDVRLDDRSAARRRCSEARQIFSGIVDSAVRDRLAADLDIATAAAADRSSRITLLTSAVNVSLERRDLFRLSRVLLLRGRAYADAGAMELAKGDFEQGLDVIEEQRQRLDLIADRLTYFEVARETAEELMRLLIGRRETSGALAVVERVRARVLLERLTGPQPDWSEAALRRRLSSGHAVLQYWADSAAL